VLWEMVTGLEKGAVPFESWKGRLEAHAIVVDIQEWKKYSSTGDHAAVSKVEEKRLEHSRTI